MLLGGSAVGYVLQKNQLHELGRQLAKKEALLYRLQSENRGRAAQLADLQSPLKLAERVRDQKMNLLPPVPGQTIWLAEPVVKPPPAPNPGLLAVHEE